MKKLWNSFKIAFSMYSKIPMPFSEWTKENMSLALCFFPLVGVVIGGLSLIVYRFRILLEAREILFGNFFWTAVLVLLPILVTGGIHMDGFMDTQDALSSYQTQERRLEILKDPHTGAFAILSCVVYMIAYLGVYSAMSYQDMKVIACSFVLSRTLSGWSVVRFPKAKKEGLAATFSDQTEKQIAPKVFIGYDIVIAAIMILVGGIQGIIGLAVAGCVFFYYKNLCKKSFGGMTGDLAGYFLQVCELAMAFAIVMVGGII